MGIANEIGEEQRCAHLFFTGAGLMLRSFFVGFGMIFGTTAIYVSISADLVRVRPPLPAVEYPVERCIWRSAGLFYLE